MEIMLFLLSLFIIAGFLATIYCLEEIRNRLDKILKKLDGGKP